MKKKFLYILISIAISSLSLNAQVSKTITLEQSGTLKGLLTSEELKSITDLTLNGQIDQRDFVIMRDSMSALININLKNTVIQAYGSNAANKLPQKAFLNNKYLSSIILPDTITEIGSYAFQYCSGLANIEIPAMVEKIETNAFGGCTSLKNINLPAQLRIIDQAAFYNCNNLININLPATVTTIGNNAFTFCTSLISIRFSESLTTIGNNAFYNCKSLTNLNLPRNLTRIGNYAFINTGITTCYIKAMVPPTIEESTFAYALHIAYVPLGAGDRYRAANYWKKAAIIEDDGISLHLNLYSAGTLSAEIAASGYNESDINSLILEGPLNDADFAVIRSKMTNLISIDLSKVTLYSLPSYTFSGCVKIANIKLPETLTDIYSCAFYGCTGLTSIYFPSKLKSITEFAFQDCTGLKSIDLPENLTSLGICAFSGCTNLTDIKLPKNLSDIKGGAFYECKSITSIDLPETLTDLDSSVFKDCTSLRSVHLPDGLKTINDYAFKNCNSLTSIIFPKTLTAIGIESFSYTNLSNVNLPASLKTLGYGCFNYCSNLTSITLPAGLTSLGNDLFYWNNLSEIKTLSQVPLVITNDPFSSVDKTICKLVVPEGCIEAYKSAARWSEFKNIIELESTGISSFQQSNLKIWVDNGLINVSSEKLIRELSMFSLSGKLLVKQESVGYSCQIEANNEKVLILKVMYEDGTSEVVKVANSK